MTLNMDNASQDRSEFSPVQELARHPAARAAGSPLWRWDVTGEPADWYGGGRGACTHQRMPTQPRPPTVTRCAGPSRITPDVLVRPNHDEVPSRSSVDTRNGRDERALSSAG